jgi:hypothetical protein
VSVLLLLTWVPFPRTISESFRVSAPGGLRVGLSPSFSTPHPGTFSFSWSANRSDSVLLTLDGAEDSEQGQPVYSESATEGGGRVDLSLGFSYTFLLSSNVNESVVISGTIQFNVPLI